MGEKQLEVLDKTGNNTFNIDKKFDYFAVRAMVIQSLERIVREDLNRHIGSIINLHKIGIHGDEDVIVANTGNPFDDQDDDTAQLTTSLLRLKIRIETSKSHPIQLANVLLICQKLNVAFFLVVKHCTAV